MTRHGYQWFRTTLYSIGDAVITTDPAGLVQEMNPPAERLTGWTEVEARGRPITDVFRIVNEETRGPVVNPVETVLARGTVVALANHTLLVARDGVERPISDSGAPILGPDGSLLGTVLVFRDGTAEREAARVLAESEARYRLMFDANPHPMWIYHPATLRFLAVNDAAVQRYGYPREEFLAMTIADIRPAAELAALLADVAAVPAGMGGSGVWVHRLKDGSLIDVEITSHSVAIGRLEGRVVLANDITARRRAERALAQSERRLREAHRVAGLASWEIDLVNRQHYWSDEMYRIFEIPAERSVWGFMDRVHPDDRARVEAAFRRSVDEGVPYDLVHRVTTPAGATKFVQATAETHYNERGRPLRSVGTLLDVTERTIAEHQLARQAALIDNVTDAVISTDLEFRVVTWNRGAEAIFGWSAEEAMGRPLNDIIKMDESDRVAAKQQFEQTGAWRGELPITRRDGEVRRILSSVSVIRDPNGRVIGAVGVDRDISEQRELEAALGQAQKMESVGRLAGGVAHDFNNTLQIVLAAAEFGLEQLPADHPAAAEIRTIELAARRSATVAKQLLAFARRQTAQPKVLDLNQVTLGIRQMLERLVGSTIQLVWRPGADLWMVWMDPSQVDQILVNLVVNARDATPGAGLIQIETANRSEAGGDFVTLTVTDSGVGMDAATMHHAFEPFFTTKDPGKGTGLGLAVVYGIVKQYRGDDDLRSTVGAGTTVEVRLPRWHGPADDGRQPVRPPTVAAGPKTILVVEDEPQILDLTGRILTRAGYEVLTAVDPIRAIEIAEQWTGRLDLVVTDVVMPHLTGKEVADRISAHRPNVRFLFVSGYPADAIATHGLVAAEIDLLQKPFSVQELTDRVAAILRDGPDRISGEAAPGPP